MQDELLLQNEAKDRIDQALKKADYKWEIE